MASADDADGCAADGDASALAAQVLGEHSSSARDVAERDQRSHSQQQKKADGMHERFDRAVRAPARDRFDADEDEAAQ